MATLAETTAYGYRVFVDQDDEEIWVEAEGPGADAVTIDNPELVQLMMESDDARKAMCRFVHFIAGPLLEEINDMEVDQFINNHTR